MPRGVLMLFAKEPVPGRVKTRLVPPLTAAEAAALYEGFVADALRTLALAARKRIDVEIHSEPAPPAAPRLMRLANLGRATSAGSRAAASWPRGVPGDARGIAVHPQAGDSLGERLLHAFERARSLGRPYAIAVGADHPALRASAIAELAGTLDRGCQAAIIPSEDGGYCALGLADPRRQFFAGVPWSTPDVLAVTLERLRAAGIAPRILGACADVDRPRDLERLVREIASRDPRDADFPRDTARALHALRAAASRLRRAARPLQEPPCGPGVTGLAYPSEKGVLR